ncbi:hypothetical protein FW774_09920 [Pedobacter sp. BS3]|uniref:hypothetical protein n=1 Tax=Pedobacter sp. BS3 TaxID=2567937 RepID=UPI0011ED59F4|nr:hypothetical protein [Pedobacter sp. BS3]TZF83776.1 hypothetical protein FW774_09920 [Pedobacter sp. BS3]
MKNIIYPLIILFSACAPKNKHPAKHIRADGTISTDSLQIITDGVIIKNNQQLTDSAKTFTLHPGLKPPLTGDLPFGSDILANTKFPSKWDTSEEATDKDKQIDDLWLQAYHYYNVIDEKKVISKPNIKNVEYIRLNYPYNFIDSITNSIDSVRYQLPDFGPYKCYYAQLTYLKAIEKPYCREAGNLILYNPETGHAKVINVFFSTEGEIEAEYRLFYIGKNRVIQIFYSKGGELESYFKREFLIRVDDDGKVVIKKL